MKYSILQLIASGLNHRSDIDGAYEITDPFLRFWFRFICPYQALIESGQLRLLLTLKGLSLKDM